MRWHWVVGLWMGLAAAMVSAAELRILVLDDAAPMAYRDDDGRLTGFTIEIARALCEEMRVGCLYQPTRLNQVIDQLAYGEADIAAVSLLDTPERRAKILFSKPYFRSVSLWFAPPGLLPGDPVARVAVVSASAQERYARIRGWATVPVPTYGGVLEPLRSGQAQAALVPMGSSFGLMKNEQFRLLELTSTVMNEPELGGDVAFGISPRRADLKPLLDAALDRIKRNGVYDRINSQFLPLRVN